MSIEEIRCNGVVKQEVMSSSEGLLTYRRRKRTRTGDGQSSYLLGDAAVSADEEVKFVSSPFLILFLDVITLLKDWIFLC